MYMSSKNDTLALLPSVNRSFRSVVTSNILLFKITVIVPCSIPVGTNLILCLPVILSVFAYLAINMNGKIGIQGDAGSFFMGSFIAILYTKSRELNELGLIFFILGPIVFDVCGTTIIKVFYKINLTIGHRDNLYQKLVSKYQSHFLITSIFVFLQFLFCFWLSALLEKNSLVFIYYILFFICSLLILFFCFVAYLIHNKKILK